MDIILQYKMIMGAVFILFLSGTLIQLLIGRYYSMLIIETDNMSTTEVELLCQCKRKFTNCYRLHNGIVNVPVFVEKYLNKIRMGRFMISTWKHISGQLVLLSVFAAGIGACIGIIEEETLGEILPFYIVSMFGLYLYFAVSGFIDLSEKKRILKINLVDYLENHMGAKLEDLEDSIKRLEEPGMEEEVRKNREIMKSIQERQQENVELEKLLREFLT